MNFYLKSSINILLFTAFIMPYIAFCTDSPNAFCTGSSNIVICNDTTGSMCDQIEMVKKGLSTLVDKLPASNLGLMEYKDYDSDPVTKVLSPTRNKDKLKDFIELYAATGGGDKAEAVEAALYEIEKMDVADVIMIFDAPPHALDDDPTKNIEDSYKSRGKIPENKHHSDGVIGLKNKRISLHTITCNDSEYDTNLWASMASAVTGGISINLKHNDEEKFANLLVAMFHYLSEEKDIFSKIHEKNQHLYKVYNAEEIENIITSDEDHKALSEKYKEILSRFDEYEILNCNWVKNEMQEIANSLYGQAQFQWVFSSTKLLKDNSHKISDDGNINQDLLSNLAERSLPPPRNTAANKDEYYSINSSHDHVGLTNIPTRFSNYIRKQLRKQQTTGHPCIFSNNWTPINK